MHDIRGANVNCSKHLSSGQSLAYRETDAQRILYLPLMAGFLFKELLDTYINWL